MNNLIQMQNSMEVIKTLLQALNINKVVYVDDAHGKSISEEDFVSAGLMLDEKELLELCPELGSSVPDDLEVKRQKLRKTWDQLTPERQSACGQAVVASARQNDGDSPDDVADISIVSHLIPHAMLVCLSPEQWSEQQDKLLNYCQNDNHMRTLFLFDQDLTGGGTTEGISIISSILSDSPKCDIICGLLTHTIKPEEQMEAWERLSKDYSVKKDRFIVIPKAYIAGSHLGFAQGLKYAALCPDFTSLKEKTKVIINNATQYATDRIDSINIFDLDHIVFRTSYNEGLWEPDMLFRLHSFIHRKNARSLAHSDTELKENANRLRLISEIPIECEILKPHSSTWDLQREELYDSAEYINGNNLPLELGDIFEKTGSLSKKKYILLAQPCDLMIRSDGKRRISQLPLVGISVSKSQYSEELPYWESNPDGHEWYVNFKDVYYINACVLDLCVFNCNGESKQQITTGDAESPKVRPGWQKRFDKIFKEINVTIKMVNECRNVACNCKSTNPIKKLIDTFLKDSLFKAEVSDNSIKFNCKRVARISRERAMGLLMAYTASMSRPAYEHEFVVKTNPSTETESRH